MRAWTRTWPRATPSAHPDATPPPTECATPRVMARRADDGEGDARFAAAGQVGRANGRAGRQPGRGHRARGDVRVGVEPAAAARIGLDEELEVGRGMDAGDRLVGRRLDRLFAQEIACGVAHPVGGGAAS